MESKQGIVYVISSPEYQDLVKIGRTNSPHAASIVDRMKALYTSGVPAPFEFEYAIVVDDAPSVERDLHTVFASCRPRSDREFFRVSPTTVRAALRGKGPEVLLNDEQVDEVDDVDIAAAGKTTRRFKKRHARFEWLDIPIGAKLESVSDSYPGETCVVVDQNNRVEYQGEEIILAALAYKLGASWKYPKNGFADALPHFTYSGEKLTARRERLGNERGVGC